MSGAKIDKKTIFQQGARIFYPIVLTFCSKKSCGEASGALFVCSLVFGFFRVDFYMPGFPDVYLRFGAGLQPLDVLAVGVNQQDGDDERKTTNGTRWLTFGDMSVKIGKEQPATIEASDT